MKADILEAQLQPCAKAVSVEAGLIAESYTEVMESVERVAAKRGSKTLVH